MGNRNVYEVERAVEGLGKVGLAGDLALVEGVARTRRRDLRGVGDVEVRQVDAGGLEPRLRQQSHECTPQLPVRAGDENAEALLSVCAPGSRKGSLLAPHRRGLVHWPTLPSPWASFCRRLTMLRR